ncbi:hypothetical protein AsFcp4_283 [Aeromonas phage AsFcp_4]|nr:hypothetical protein ASfcp2_46 [Aeromonas phage AsFcp_2]QAX99734.1 hypothetical protein AsFcp4_283 [Aeromonas phage AsFcp_4]
MNQALVEQVKSKIDSRLVEYVRVKSRKSLGEETMEVIMVGAKIGCSDLEYFNNRWAHFMLHAGETKFEAICGDCKWKSGVKFPVLRKQKTRELACDKIVEFINKNTQAFIDCYKLEV